MPTRDGLTAILDRIASDTYTTNDLDLLGQAMRVRGDKNVVQLGRYNVRLERGDNVHIGDRIYQGVEADAIRSALQDVVQDRGQIGPTSPDGPHRPSCQLRKDHLTRPERGGSDLFEHPARRYTARRGTTEA